MEVEDTAETKDNEKCVKSPGLTDLAPLPTGGGEKSGGNLPPIAIVEKSPESGNLTEDQLVGHSVKAPTPDFGPAMVTKFIKETMAKALIGMRKDLVEELGRGRTNAKRAKDSNLIAPRINGRYQKHSILPKSISSSTIPQGALPDWRSINRDATPPVQRELLCIYEVIWSLSLGEAF